MVPVKQDRWEGQFFRQEGRGYQVEAVRSPEVTQFLPEAVPDPEASHFLMEATQNPGEAGQFLPASHYLPGAAEQAR